MASIKITECSCCGNRDHKKFIQKSDGYICKICGIWFRYETEEEEAGCMDGRRRLKNYRFDDAKETFMDVLAKYPNSIDALWGSLLARYGIVFVKGFFDDTAEPIYCFPEYDEYGERKFRDERAYKKILKLLEERDEDLMLSDFYEKKAAEIDRAIAKFSEAKKNTDIDVFICVKISAATEETPEKSGRTKDYDYAMKVYNDLTAKGVKTFFSYVTLQNNVESDDLIWANLVKSKKMLLIGSTECYLESAWVKSEWKRWLYLGREKKLYICSMKHDNEHPKSILPHELASLRPQVYTLDTYDKMIDEICNAPALPAEVSTVIAQPEADTKDGKIVYLDGSEEIIPYGTSKINDDQYSGKKDIVSVALPATVTEIGCRAFCDCSRLRSVKMADGVRTMGSSTFLRCHELAKIYVPITLLKVGGYSFEGCYKLNDVYYGGTREQFTLIDLDGSSINNYGHNSIFRGARLHCSGKVVYQDGEEALIPYGTAEIKDGDYKNKEYITKIFFPDTVTAIGEGAFRGCPRLASIEIPSSVETIGKDAFGDCPQLNTVQYGGAKSEWRKIKIGKGNPKLTGIVAKMNMRTGCDLLHRR